MGQILGTLQNIEIDVAGGSSYKTLVCLRTSSVNSTATVNEDETNCGILKSIGDASFSFDFDAVCETAPSGSQITYKDLLTVLVAKTKITVRFQSPAIGAISAGAVYYHQCEAYVTDLTLNQDAAGGAYVNFSGTITSTGTLDITA